MILSCQNITKTFGTDVVMKNASFHIEEHEKAAIVGINGAGKSTLLKIIVKELEPDEGIVAIAKEKTVGYLAQNEVIDSTRTIYEEVLSAKQPVIDMEQEIHRMEAAMDAVPAGELEAFMEKYERLVHQFELADGYTYRSEVTGVLNGLGFSESDFGKTQAELSGGQKTRAALCRLLVTKPDILLLDEPTNHLDMESIQWLENYLLNYKGAVLIVSHDRYFMDKIVSKVIEVFQHQVASYTGNYTAYAQKKAQVRAAQLRAYYNQQQEIKHQEEVIAKLKSFNREKSIKRAESREKMLDKMKRLDKPVEDLTDIHLHLAPSITSGNDVMRVEHLAKSFDGKKLFEQVDFSIFRGERVALIGNNGTGKTTILKIINDMLPADDGEITLGTNVQVGYYDQEHQVLHTEKTLFEEISEDYPHLTNTQIRNVLAAFLFTNDDVFKRIGDLSGGERGRVSLAKLMLSEANFLILDEPTNHLDITSKEILENALVHYEGTVLFVSHDRYFINRTATRILDLHEQQVLNYIGNYDYYLEKRDVQRAAQLQPARNAGETMQAHTADAANPAFPKSAAQKAATGSKEDWKLKKQQQAAKRKAEQELSRVEERIETLETEKKELEAEMAAPEVAVISAKVMELHSQLVQKEEELEALYEKWEELTNA
ncbi:MAG: ABC-F type ribosomal protection protein [Eubacterium sp.]|nr:ABC-F type ribosomal protection protein [Eubacterium sp.]